jgi:hypothetical protein
MHALPESGVIKTIVETLVKPFTLIANPIAERIGNRFKRKPKLYIHIHPITSIWCYAWEGANNPIMQVRFDADITNDSDHEAVIMLAREGKTLLAGSFSSINSNGSIRLTKLLSNGWDRLSSAARPCNGSEVWVADVRVEHKRRI